MFWRGARGGAEVSEDSDKGCLGWSAERKALPVKLSFCVRAGKIPKLSF